MSKERDYSGKYLVDNSRSSELLNVLLTPCNLVKNEYQARILLVKALIVRAKLGCCKGKENELILDDFRNG